MPRIAVSVAGLWRSPQAARPIDAPALSAPVQLEAWLAALDDTTRLALCRDKLLVSQVLFDTPVTVLERTTDETGRDWCRVVVPSQASALDPRGYPGWLPAVQLAEERPAETAGDVGGLADGVGEDDLEGEVVVTASRAELVLTSPRQGGSAAGDGPLALSFLTRLRRLAMTPTRVEVISPLGRGWLSRDSVQPAETPLPADAATLTQLGQRFEGLRYLWAGNSSFGYDCSGLVHSLFAAIGIALPRDAGDQLATGTPVALEARRAGDLLYFEKPDASGRPVVDHVGLYLGEDTLLHAPTNNARVERRRLSGSHYAEQLCAVRRHLG
ncbi:NlpC/P60 family protein [Salinicola endophyticus]|uniref:NlpC/P60 family protein n=1 Tax=Salinicola endophyticus TaxID=1949083 RepID=A0ABY8FG77_9GAMM|nr:C40 family peptidase [Salinicola endophyticus]WFF41819.1 NlpC/P60 family protein [Salinicola endophyticus]